MSIIGGGTAIRHKRMLAVWLAIGLTGCVLLTAGYLGRALLSGPEQTVSDGVSHQAGHPRAHFRF